MQKSTSEITREWIKVSAACASKCFRIRAMLLKWKKADLQEALICSSIESDELNSAPIFRAVFDGLITHRYIQGKNLKPSFACYIMLIFQNKQDIQNEQN